MVEKELNCYSGPLNIKFYCDECKTEIDKELWMPAPNWNAERDTHSDTRSDSYDIAYCPKCEKNFDIQLVSSICGSWLYINNLEDNSDVLIDYLTDDEPLRLNRYYLMHKDIKTAEISIDEDDGSIYKVNQYLNKEHIPIRASHSKNDLKRWWEERAIPKTRKGLRTFLESRNIHTTGNYLVDNLGLSLTDCYWIKPINSEVCWDEVNLFKNKFESEMSLKRKNLQSFYTPNASTGGDLPKWWIIKNNIRYLIKGNEGGTTQQSRNEILASLIHETQGFHNYVDYKLVKLKDNKIGCKCAAFTSENVEFISAWDLIGRSSYSKSEPFRGNFINECVKGGLDKKEVIAQLDYMALTDFIISNTDRHLNNFGVLRDPDTLKYIKLAPIFDSGNSMMFSNTANISIMASLKESIKGFYTDYKKSIEHINNLNCVDLSLMPSQEDVVKIYTEDNLLISIAEDLGRLYSSKINFVKQLQEGKSYYNIARTYGVR